LQLSLYNDQPPSSPCFESLQKDSLLDRLKALDARASRKGLGALDPARSRLVRIGMEVNAAGVVTKSGFGVFNLSWQAQHHPEWSAAIESEIASIRARLLEAHGSRLRFVIWVATCGGAEDKHLYNAAGLLKRGPRSYVLDSADPAKLKAILEDMTRRSRLTMPDVLKSTLVVGMAMDATSYEPVLNLEKLALLYEKHEVDPQANFLYLTVSGSLLDRFASRRGYRKVELQPDSCDATAAWHTAPLTRGSLYALGLSGVPLREWMDATWLTEEEVETAWRLAAFLQAQGAAGRDKVTLILPKPWSGAALWTKQDFEKSLGKGERAGIRVVIDEKLKLPNYRAPKDDRQDRVFLAVQVKGMEVEDSQKIALLRRAGYPVAVLVLPRGSVLSRYLQFIHYVVFGLAWARDVNFVTQPNTRLYQAIVQRLHDRALEAGGIEQTREWKTMRATPCQAKWRNRVTLYYHLVDGVEADSRTAPEVYATLLNRFVERRVAEYAELTFFADMRCSANGRSLRKKLGRAAETLFRSRLKMPVDIGEGPAISHGKAFSTVLLAENAATLPPLGYTADYHRAEFLATVIALAERGCPAVAILVKDLEVESLAALDEFFRQAAKHVNL
jgi:hypothetical protein